MTFRVTEEYERARALYGNSEEPLFQVAQED